MPSEWFNDAALAISQSETKPYLGDPLVVETLLRNAIGNVLDNLDEPDAGKRLTKLLTECKAVAAVLLGASKQFVPMRRWNEPGRIDQFAAKWLGAAEADPLDRLEHCVLLMFNELFDLADVASIDGVLDEQWTWQIDAIVQKYAGVFVGMDLPTQASN